jgi:hypothetical protein
MKGDMYKGNRTACPLMTVELLQQEESTKVVFKDSNLITNNFDRANEELIDSNIRKWQISKTSKFEKKQGNKLLNSKSRKIIYNNLKSRMENLKFLEASSSSIL